MPVRRKFPMPDGTEREGIEVDFDTIKEAWNEYRLEDGTRLRIKTVLIRAVRLLDENGQPAFTELGDPEVLVNTSVSVVGSQDN